MTRADTTASNADIKALRRTHQVQAAWFHDVFGSTTMPEIIQAVKVEAAFQRVLDDPAAAASWFERCVAAPAAAVRVHWSGREASSPARASQCDQCGAVRLLALGALP